MVKPLMYVSIWKKCWMETGVAVFSPLFLYSHFCEMMWISADPDLCVAILHQGHIRKWVVGLAVDHLICNHFSRKVLKSGLRNLVREKWIFKLGFFSGSRKAVDQKKMWVYTINPHFFQVGEKWFCKLGFLFCFEKSGRQEKRG